ncbi:hypothetical protein IWQ57_004623 [Coemansia nantahalensis]|uniref:Uncharacterized protein n=1 Tax=Coemansia nantahalensis TaxID=2789366 RepID=A0ACC1JRT8_9FUNG|nr:hypothetical protein IWQ57_004623 [Coemansia nantahalensis]
MLSLEAHGPSRRATSNPAPLGNSGFAVATLAAALHAGGIGIAAGSPPNVVVGLAVFCGGLAQLAAGAWSFVANVGFDAVVFTLYGCYWLAYAATLIPASGVPAVLRDADPATRAHSLGIFYLVWVVQTFVFLLGAARGAWGTFAQLLLLLVTNVLTCAGTWSQSPAVLRASGYAGVFTAAAAWYNVAADMLTRETCYFSLPNPPISPPPSAPAAKAEEPRRRSLSRSSLHMPPP